jgi:hypothetical protein
MSDLLGGRQTLERANKSQLKQMPFRNMYIDNRSNDIAIILLNYFKAVEERWPNAWREVGLKGNLLPKSNAFKALMRLLRDKYVDIVKGDFSKLPSINDFKPLFADVEIEDDDFTTRAFPAGSSGESKFYKLLTGTLTLEQLLEG